MERAAGVLCHISSLPSKYGIGGLGKEAYAFARRLKKSGVKYWQILPLVQTGYGDSPYQSVSCCSGNPYFIDLAALKKQGLLSAEELKAAEHETLDFGTLYEERYATLRLAFSRFSLDNQDFRAFVKSGAYRDYALYMTAKTVFGGNFSNWEEGIRRHEEDALDKLCTDYHEEYLFWQFLQFVFFEQWKQLKDYVNSLEIRVIGDIPLYVSYDSCDVWAHSNLFKLDEDLNPVKVSGVPPDYFSEDGQLWGSPVYDWAANEREDFSWWRNRLKQSLEIYDLVRVDHFRGIDRYYEIPAEDTNARNGKWRNGPKEKLFEGLPKGHIIAEDLGEIDDGVRTLLKKTDFPGMKVLLFAFDGNDDNAFLPRNIGENCVVYTGTHDNDTVAGYVKSLSPEEYVLFRSRVAKELEKDGLHIRFSNEPKRVASVFMEMALSTKANLAVIPVQDVLGLDNDFRMNTPGTNGENWKFRLDKMPTARDFSKFKKLIKKYER